MYICICMCVTMDGVAARRPRFSCARTRRAYTGAKQNQPPTPFDQTNRPPTTVAPHVHRRLAELEKRFLAQAKQRIKVRP